MSQPGPDDDAVWQEIIDNFGDTPEMPTAEPATEPIPVEYDEPAGFVPPAAPPVGLPHGARGLAWAGVLGMPLLALLLAVFRIALPGVAIFLLVVWFVAGFGYLVAHMDRRGPEDGWDDGARL